MNGTRVPGTAKIFKYGRVSAMNLCGQTDNSKPQHACDDDMVRHECLWISNINSVHVLKACQMDCM